MVTCWKRATWCLERPLRKSCWPDGSGCGKQKAYLGLNDELTLKGPGMKTTENDKDGHSINHPLGTAAAPSVSGRRPRRLGWRGLARGQSVRSVKSAMLVPWCRSLGARTLEIAGGQKWCPYGAIDDANAGGRRQALGWSQTEN